MWTRTSPDTDRTRRAVISVWADGSVCAASCSRQPGPRYLIAGCAAHDRAELIISRRPSEYEKEYILKDMIKKSFDYAEGQVFFRIRGGPYPNLKAVDNEKIVFHGGEFHRVPGNEEYYRYLATTHATFLGTILIS